ncbi:class I SAM-dependent methyltransferase [Aquabacterium sp.]|uniref:class I SAM-dependent methyltransferase n=1 Tax=Aquabacterium sp. TaxID=1872578 RepID=UPI003D05ADBF
MNPPSSRVNPGYYTQHAEAYARTTRTVDMAPLYARFLPHVPAGGLILDAGCGSGRDALAFLQQGYAVEAFDASPELAQLASQHAGIPVKVMRFQDVDDTALFDAIWACASLLHVPEREQPEAWRRLWRALKPGGVVYASYKLGQAERVDEAGRAFTDADEARLSEWLNPLQGIARLETWLTTDQRPGQMQTWLNGLVFRQPAAR